MRLLQNLHSTMLPFQLFHNLLQCMGIGGNLLFLSYSFLF